jgi:hypothetical protein
MESILWVFITCALEELDFITCCFGVVGCGFDDFHCCLSFCLRVVYEPDGGKVTPSQFVEDDVAALFEGFSNAYRMISTWEKRNEIN